MSTDRPMNEYEGALFSAMIVLTQTVAHLLPDRAQLAEMLREDARMDREASHLNGAATLELLARIAEADRYYTARPRPPFTPTIIDGGKK